MEVSEDSPLCNDNTTRKKQSTTHEPAEQPTLPENTLLILAGYLARFAACFSYAVSVGCAQALGGYVPRFQLNLWRFFAQCVVCLPFVLHQRQNIVIPRQDIPYVMLVCASSNIINLTIFEAAVYLPAGTVTCVYSSLYLVFTSGIVMSMSRKCLSLHTWGAVVLVLSGIVFITQPAFLFGEDDHPIHPICSRDKQADALLFNLSAEYLYSLGNSTGDVSAMSPISSNSSNYLPTIHSSNLLIYYLYVAICASAYTLISFCINKKLKNTNSFVLSMCTGISGVVISLAGIGIFETPMLPSGTNCQLLLVGHAIGTSSNNILNVLALTFITADVSALISGLSVVFLFVAQYTVLKNINPGHRNVMEAVGAAEVLLGTCVDPAFTMFRNIKPNKEDKENA